ncbi:MAG: metal-sulfur cluster assembly factor [Candidatus Aenigmarchaeota archaeon]|nr:metal-sulfur cluster assembly factor [Candidatus Aenigmarchaeota archaeon]
MVNPTKKDVMNLLKDVTDPELGYSIVDLGFVTGISVNNKKKTINVKLVLTTPLCPLTGYVFTMVESKLKRKYPKYSIEVEYDFDTQWTPERIKPEIRKKLGL